MRTRRNPRQDSENNPNGSIIPDLACTRGTDESKTYHAARRKFNFCVVLIVNSFSFLLILRKKLVQRYTRRNTFFVEKFGQIFTRNEDRAVRWRSVEYAIRRFIRETTFARQMFLFFFLAGGYTVSSSHIRGERETRRISVKQRVNQRDRNLI